MRAGNWPGIQAQPGSLVQTLWYISEVSASADFFVIVAHVALWTDIGAICPQTLFPMAIFLDKRENALDSEMLPIVQIPRCQVFSCCCLGTDSSMVSDRNDEEAG